MGLVVSETASRTPAPAGTHLANCFGLIDLGTQTSNFNGKVEVKPRIWLWWELWHEKREDGKPVTCGRYFTATLSEKGNLRPLLQAWRGKPFTAEELKPFRLQSVVGAPCMVTIVHEPKKSGGISDKVNAVSGLPKGMAREPLAMPRTILDLDPANFDRAVFDGLPNFLKKDIIESPEGRALGLAAGGGKEWPQQPADDWDAQGKPIRNGVTVYGDADPNIPF